MFSWRGNLTERQIGVVRLREAGMTFQEIAAELGVTRQRAHQIFKVGAHHK
jgi:transcriptional regulator